MDVSGVPMRHPIMPIVGKMTRGIEYAILLAVARLEVEERYRRC